MSGSLDHLDVRLLVVRCRAGDGEAFGELVRRYAPRLWYFARKLVGDASAADDVTQQLWLAVHRGLARLADPAAFPAWAYRIARNLSARYRRDRGHWEELPEVAGPEPEFSAADAEAVHAALDRLPEPFREVLVLRFLEGMSCDDIAAVVGTPCGTVRSRLHYGKRALKRILERGGSDERR